MARGQQTKVRIGVKRLRALEHAEARHKEKHRATYSMLVAAVSKFGTELVVTKEDLQALEGFELHATTDEDGSIRLAVTPVLEELAG